MRQQLRELLSRVGPRPIILNQDREALSVLENSFDVVIDQEVNGIDELSFSLPLKDSKRDFIQNENLVQMFGTLYVIRDIGKRRTSSGESLEVFAEALWYDLQFSDPLTITDWNDATAYQILQDILAGTGWEVGNVTIDSRRNIQLNNETDNVLSALVEVREIFGGDLSFDTVNKTVSFLKEETQHSGASIVYRKNMEDIEARYDTRNIVTRLYVYGKDGLTIKTANDGLPYIEDYSFTKTRRVRSIKNEKFTNPYHLKEFAQKQLEILSVPSVAYKLTAHVLSNVKGLEHERFTIGSIVRVYDKELQLDSNTRIMKWSFDVINPENTKIDLETRSKDLSDLLSGDNGRSDSFGSGSVNDEQEVMEMSVYNHLLNSRADDGYSYWMNNGWEVDLSNGYTGDASFKVSGQLGVTKEIKQIINPSHRDSYSISFRAKSENLEMGENGRVGAMVKIKYTDGTEETKFVSLA
jgi:phage minor structural protein